MSFSEYFPIWDKLTPGQQERLASLSEFRKVKKGTILHNGSRDCLGLLLIRSGQLRAYILSDEGREITIHRMFEMDICLYSASCVMPNMQFDVVIEAEKDSEIWVIPACLYKNLMDESLAVSNYSNYLMSSHFTELMWLVEQVMWKSFDKRLAGFLVEECRLEETTSLKITHEKIANHMGTAREVVTRMLRYFQNEEMVRLTRGTVEVVDMKRLDRLAEE
ncbi:MAG: Crp/Fnr family transcriptional regulator [Lachnospiraceae bacterium]|nr:Crp/Fnr family transcriptional regulator [Lachnospiraceae bacterium]